MQSRWGTLGQHGHRQRPVLSWVMLVAKTRGGSSGKRRRGDRPPRCAHESNSRDWCWSVSGSHLHQHHPLRDPPLTPRCPHAPGHPHPFPPGHHPSGAASPLPGLPAPPGTSATQLVPTAQSKKSKRAAVREEMFSFGEVLLLFSVCMSAETQGLSGGCSQSSIYWRCFWLSPVLILHCVITLLFSFILLFSLIWQLPEKPKATRAVYFKIFKICW